MNINDRIALDGEIVLRASHQREIPSPWILSEGWIEPKFIGLAGNLIPWLGGWHCFARRPRSNDRWISVAVLK